MADLMSILQANAAPPRGWTSVGQALAGLGGAGREDAYNRGMAKAAQLDQLVQTARYSREKAMEAEDARKGRGGFAPAAIAAGIPEAQAGLLSSALMAGYDPTKVSGYLGQSQEQGFREGAVGRALAGDFGGGNAYLMGVANGPVELASVQGQNLINNRLLEGGGGISTTEQGRAAIAADAAQAAASYASAASHNASAARTRQGMALDRADILGGGGGRPSSKAPSGYRWNAAGGLEFIPGGPADPAMKSAGAPTEGERKSATLLARLEGSLGQMNQAIDDDAGAAKPSVLAAIAGGLPFSGETARNLVNSSERQRVEAAQLDILDAALTLGTGAAYTKEQLEGYRKSFFPQLGDSADTVADKQDRLDNVVNSARIAAGRAAPAADSLPANSRLRPAADINAAFGGGVRPTTGQAPAVGTIRNGYRYAGGNPADQSSWEKL